METCRISSQNIAGCVKKAAEMLRSGGVILYPTDTLYGLGADALNDDAVAKIYAIKGRDEKKPIHCIVADMAMAEKYAEVSDDARILAKRFMPGPLTLILKKREGVTGGIARNMSTIGIRIPNNDFCLALANEFGRPYTTTSANRSDMEPERSVERILAQLDGAKSYTSVLQKTAITANIDLVIDAGELPAHPPSTVVDISGSRPLILREAAITAAEIWDELGERY